MENAGKTLHAITSYMASKHGEQKKESESLSFARHLVNELDAIQSVRLRKQVQLQVLQCVLEAQLAEMNFLLSDFLLYSKSVTACSFLFCGGKWL